MLILMVLGVDGQTDGQSRIQSRRFKKALGQVTLILRLSCKQEVKDIYTVFQGFFEYIFEVNFFEVNNSYKVQILF